MHPSLRDLLPLEPDLTHTPDRTAATLSRPGRTRGFAYRLYQIHLLRSADATASRHIHSMEGPACHWCAWKLSSALSFEASRTSRGPSGPHAVGKVLVQDRVCALGDMPRSGSQE